MQKLSIGWLIVKCAFTALIMLSSGIGHAREYADLQVPDTPLVLKAQGSFFVGGERVPFTRTEFGDFLADGHATVNQMYVRYMVPEMPNPKIPIVMIHGMGLTGNSWETTPDGRMGWDEYFVRKGHPSFVIDQVGRGRSGFDERAFNRARAGLSKSDSQAKIRRFSDESMWPNFRFGSEEGTPYSETQFPHEAVADASLQIVPDLTYGGVPDPNPTHKALANLGRQVGGAILMGHSQGGPFPIEASLQDASGIRGLIMLEPGSISSKYSDEEIKKLANLPMLFVFGDYIGSSPEGTLNGHHWQTAIDESNAFIKRINAAGGNATMIHLPKAGIRGNSHMLMEDRNHLQVADMIMDWIDKNVAIPAKK